MTNLFNKLLCDTVHGALFSDVSAPPSSFYNCAGDADERQDEEGHEGEAASQEEDPVAEALRIRIDILQRALALANV